ncbi:hypothetical protein MSG28_013931 [Choristoneura fumiferana]|uniref:Uncharacterized protein n=1 Tax=Choristoneura fumiferana TaxID=7141 RepID=A0ACC0KA02_CHOFU|nr:hypothetical protein MSG28_013931 [Choristoneura fumiferana]
MLDVTELDGPPPLRRASSAAEPPPHPHPHPHPTARGGGAATTLTRRASLDDLEQQSCELAPKIENRIVLLDKPEKLQSLIADRTRWEADSVIKEVDDESSP